MGCGGSVPVMVAAGMEEERRDDRGQGNAAIGMIGAPGKEKNTEEENERVVNDCVSDEHDEEEDSEEDDEEEGDAAFVLHGDTLYRYADCRRYYELGDVIGE